MTDAAADNMLVADIKASLRCVIDPELGHNVVDLGLIYEVTVESSAAARVVMTTTTRGCPATAFLKRGVYESASSVPGVASVDVTLTYDPPWTPQMMSDDAKQFLGIR
jgi:metal-sulfur cluster biosynthetic enzyme